MEIFAVSDLVVEVRNKTLIKYEGYVKDGENAYLSDATYKRAFEKEFREKLDDLISASACVVLRDSEGMQPYMDNPDGHSAWLMSAQAERCFPDIFITTRELKGMTPEERHRYLVERKFSNCRRNTGKWTKYKKGKGKK